MTTRSILLLVLACLLASLPAFADEDRWLVRTRLLFIEPNDGATGVLDSVSAEVDSDLTVEIDASYFFTPNWAIEGILATAAQEITADLGGGRTSLGSAYHAPATVLGQYHFNADGRYSPYVGVGLNYTIFYSESGTLADLDLDGSSVGIAGQLGVDCELGDGKVFNVDVKYVEIEADVDDPGSVLVGGSLGSVEVNPLIVGVGFGFRF